MFPPQNVLLVKTGFHIYEHLNILSLGAKMCNSQTRLLFMFPLSFLFVLFLLLKKGTNPTIFQKLDTSNSDCPLFRPTTSQICCRLLNRFAKKEKNQNQHTASGVRIAILVRKRYYFLANKTKHNCNCNYCFESFFIKEFT